jgi:hypothetical protein
MTKRSTIIFKFSKQMGSKRRRQSEEFLSLGLTECFSPSEITVQNILAFAKAYRVEKSDVLGAIEMVIN